MNKILICLFAAAVSGASVRGQGTFQNLDFEAARVVFVTNGPLPYIAATNALPAWLAYVGTTQLTAVAYNWAAVIPQVGLFGSNGGPVISGTFDVLVSKGGSITQTGLVPANAQSLLFKEQLFAPSLVPLGVSLGGQTLAYSQVASNSNYVLYGADISSFSGQTVGLTFLAPPNTFYLIDDIQFTIPEPGGYGVLATAAALAGMRLFRRRG